VKRTTLFTLSILVILATLLTSCSAPKTKVTVATDATFPPFEYVDETTQEMTGFDIELIKLVAEKAGLDISIENTPFDSVTAGISQCQFDVAIAAITITDDRKENMLFSEPYINAGQTVVVRKDETEITGYADLTGKTVAAQLGTTGAIEAEKIQDVTFKPYDSYDLAFLDLQNNQVDAVIVDYVTAIAFLAKNPDQLMTVGEVFTDESYGIAVCKNKTDLLDKINAALATLEEEGKIKELETKYLAE
jgi:polar amino acid transport system substrate-binding protein